MDYIKYSLVALVGWGIWAIGSKILSRYFNVVSLSFWISLWSILFISIFLLARKNLVTNNHIFYAAPVGLFSLIAILAFYKALKIGPVSVVLPLTNLYVIFPVLYGFLFLNEAITLTRILGIVFAIIATILLSL